MIFPSINSDVLQYINGQSFRIIYTYHVHSMLTESVNIKVAKEATAEAAKATPAHHCTASQPIVNAIPQIIPVKVVIV